MDKSFLASLSVETDNVHSLNLSPDTIDELRFALVLREIKYLESCDRQIAYDHLVKRAANQYRVAQDAIENARVSRDANDEDTAIEYETDATEAKRREQEYRLSAKTHLDALVRRR